MPLDRRLEQVQRRVDLAEAEANPSDPEQGRDGVSLQRPDQRCRLGATLSIPASRRQSVKLSASTGTPTFRGSDLDAVSATWRVVWF